MTMMRRPPAPKPTIDGRVQAWWLTFLAMAEHMETLWEARTVEGNLIGSVSTPEERAALITAAAQLVVGADITSIEGMSTLRDGFLTRPSTEDGVQPAKIKPEGALCAVCGKVIGSLDPGSWDETRGEWTHTTPMCLLREPDMMDKISRLGIQEAPEGR